MIQYVNIQSQAGLNYKSSFKSNRPVIKGISVNQPDNKPAGNPFRVLDCGINTVNIKKRVSYKGIPSINYISKNEIPRIMHDFTTGLIDMTRKGNLGLENVKELQEELVPGINVDIKDVAEGSFKEAKNAGAYSLYDPKTRKSTLFINFGKDSLSSSDNKKILIYYISHEFTHVLQNNTCESDKIYQQLIRRRNDTGISIFSKAWLDFENTIKKHLNTGANINNFTLIQSINIDRLTKTLGCSSEQLIKLYDETIANVSEKYGIMSTEDKEFVSRFFSFECKKEGQAYREGLNALKMFTNNQDKTFTFELLPVLYSHISDHISKAK